VLLDRALRLYSLLHNLFMPSMKLISKKKEPGGRWKKHYEKVPRTPCQRLLESDRLQPEQRVGLEKMLEANDPLSLMARVQTLLKELRAAQQAKDLTPSKTKTSKAA
jgi:Lon protease-like protein